MNVTKLARVSVSLLAVALAAHLAWAGESIRVTATRANLRSGPSTTSRVVAKVDRGAQLEVLGREGDWIRVAVPGSGATAYIHSSLCEASAPAAPEAAPSRPAAPASPSVSAAPVHAHSSQTEPFELGAHAGWASKSLDFGLGARAAAGIPLVPHLGALVTFTYFFGTTAASETPELSGHSLKLAGYATYSFEVETLHAYAGAGVSYLSTSVDASTTAVAASASSTSFAMVAGAKFKKRFFAEVSYQFGDASHVAFSAGVLFGLPR